MKVVKFTTKTTPTHKNLKHNGDYVGMRFGKLVVIGYPLRDKGIRGAGVYCVCDCGEPYFEYNYGRLLNGIVTCCNKCARKIKSENAKRRWAENPLRISRYGDLRNERLFNVWMRMKSRCGRARGYEDVSVCEEWRDDYLAFREWAYSHGYDENAPKGQCTIDRINPFGNYEPSNCRFVDMKVQSKNKRRNWANLDEETRKMLLETALNN